MKIGFYAGSFDPFTNGHLHVVQIASRLFDKVIVGIGINPKKKRRFEKQQMKNAIENTFKMEGLKNCECIIFDGLTVDVAKEVGACFLIRGIRNGMDYAMEENLSQINEELGNLDTLYLRSGKYGTISSSMVCELLEKEKDVAKYLPEPILSFIKSKN